MALLARRPCAFTQALRQTTSISTTISRSFFTRQTINTSSPLRTRLLKSWRPLTAKSIVRSQSTNSTFNTGFNQGTTRQRLLYGAGIFGGTLVAINLVFNRETRDDGGMPAFERAYLNDTFMHTGLGIGIIAIAARALHANGWSQRLMAANPWLVLGVGLVGSIGTMMACRATPPENYVAKYGLWTAFNLTQAALLSPMLFFAPGILARAGLYTVGMMGSLAFVGATAKQDKYLYLGGPLLAGVAIVALSGLAPMVLPVTAARTLMFTENLWLYGGLAVFGGFTLYDVQKVLHHARLAQRGLMKTDPVNESISLELNTLNAFIRIAQILQMQQSRRR